MRNQVRTGVLLLVLALLMMMPLPQQFAHLAPPWILLWVLERQFFHPQNFRLLGIVFLGLFMDVLCVSVLGTHVFSLMMSVLLASYASRRFVFFSSVQQIICIALCCTLYQLSQDSLDLMQGLHPSLGWSLFGALEMTLIWPCYSFIAQNRTTQLNHTLFNRVH